MGSQGRFRLSHKWAARRGTVVFLSSSIYVYYVPCINYSPKRYHSRLGDFIWWYAVTLSALILYPVDNVCRSPVWLSARRACDDDGYDVLHYQLWYPVYNVTCRSPVWLSARRAWEPPWCCCVPPWRSSTASTRFWVAAIPTPRNTTTETTRYGIHNLTTSRAKFIAA